METPKRKTARECPGAPERLKFENYQIVLTPESKVKFDIYSKFTDYLTNIKYYDNFVVDFRLCVSKMNINQLIDELNKSF